MGTSIVKLEDHYLEWSSIVDAPITFGMSRAEFETYYRAKHGREGASDLFWRMARVDAKGTSSVEDASVDDTIWINRAGPGEIPLSKAEIVEWYVRRKRRPTADETRERRATFPKCDPCIAAPDENGCGRMCRCWGSGVIDS